MWTDRSADRPAGRRGPTRWQRLSITLTVLALLVVTAIAVPVVLRSGDDPQLAGAGSVAVPGGTTLPAPAATSGAGVSVATKDAAKASTQTVSASDEPDPVAMDLPVLTEGDYGDVIAVAQEALGMKATGYFGPQTRAAVEAFQADAGLPSTGKVAEYTWTALGGEALADAQAAVALPQGYVNSSPAAPEETTHVSSRAVRRTNAEPPTLEETDSGDAVVILQQALGVKPASGYFGPVTAKAVRRFQANNGIPTTGMVATYTWAALGPDVSGQAAEAHAAYGTDFGPGAGKGGSKGNGNGKGNGGGSSSQGNGKGLFCPVASFTYGDGLGAPRPDGRTHQGLDLMGSRGEPIYSIDSGEVTRAEYQDNGALVLDITGDRGMYFYGHFDEIVVGYGEWVKAGQLIGYMGDTGSPGAVHLHLEVRPDGWNGGPDDPVPLIQSLCG